MSAHTHTPFWSAFTPYSNFSALYFVPCFYFSLSFGFPICPFWVMFYVSFFVPVRSCSRIRAPSSYQYSSLTSAFSSLRYRPVTVKEPETVIGKNPSEHKRQGWASVHFKRTFRSLRSFPCFITEWNNLCDLFRSF